MPAFADAQVSVPLAAALLNLQIFRRTSRALFIQASTLRQ
jgi:hypothetical protein